MCLIEIKEIFMAAHDEFNKSNPLQTPPDDVDFDQLQNEFDARLSSNEQQKSEGGLVDEQSQLTDLAFQDTSELLATADMRAFDLPSDKPINDHEPIPSDDKISPDEISPDKTSHSDLPDLESEPEEIQVEPAMPEAANEVSTSEHNATAGETPDAAATDAVEDSLPSVHQEDADALSHLDGEPEPAAPEIADDSEANQKIFLQESDLSNATTVENEADWQPMLDKHAADLDGIDPFSDDSALADKAPIHPDVSEDDTTQHRGGGGRFVMLAGIIVLAVAGGIYWFVSGMPEQAEQLASSQNQRASNTEDKQPGLSDASSVNPLETPAAPEKTQADVATLEKKDSQQGSKKAVAAPQAETKKAAIQRAAVEKAKVKRLAAKQAAEKRAVAEIASARKLAVIQPSTPLQKSPVKTQVVTTSALDEPGNWIIELASVSSDKSARQYVARIRAMGVESESVKVNDKGRIFHHIRIAGFTSKLEATKRRDALIKQLGIQSARVEKL
jgi:cell division septation protein DedD